MPELNVPTLVLTGLSPARKVKRLADPRMAGRRTRDRFPLR